MAAAHVTVKVTDIDEFWSTLRPEYRLISLVPTVLTEIEPIPGEPPAYVLADEGPSRLRFKVTEWVAVMRYEPA